VALWPVADLVLITPVALRQALALALPRRPRVVVVTSGAADPALWQVALAAGATTVVSLPDGEGWLVNAFAEAAQSGSTSAPVVVVIGARGGAGASILAAALARVAVRDGLGAYLVDLDPAGCGLNVVLGVDGLRGNGWDDLAAAVGRIPPRTLRQGLPEVAGVRILTWTGARALPPGPGVPGSVVESAARDADLVVVDLARWMCATPGEAASTALEVLTRADQVLLVTPADVRSALAARRLLGAGVLVGMPVGLVVRGPAPGALQADDIAEALGLPLVATMPAEPRVDRALEEGQLPGRRSSGPLLSAAAAVLESVARRVVTAR
jgi:secretion/DNA translocation related CpaE-like protein